MALLRRSSGMYPMKRTYKTLTWNDRLKIEAWLKTKTPIKKIAEMLGVHFSTIYREVKRGQYEHLNSDWTTEMRYSPDISEQKKQRFLRAKGPDLKIGNDYSYAEYLENKIAIEKYSPGAALGEIKHKKLKFKTTISKTTLYRYIHDGVFLVLSNDDLPLKNHRKHKNNEDKKASKPSRGDSIEKRPDEISERKFFGDWEMDCVEGKKKTKKTLLVLAERKTRNGIVCLMPDKTAASVKAALDKIEEKLGTNTFMRVFHSITVDNGVEFSDCKGIEYSRTGKQRTKLYYCHPYSAYERGSNENLNRLIRRHYPKGYDFTHTTLEEIAKLEDWLNNYPREMFGFQSAKDLYEPYVDAILLTTVPQ